MKSMANILETLADRLSDFGQDADSLCVINEAIAQNSWFALSDILEAVKAISSQMLSLDLFTEWMSHYPALPEQTPQDIAIIMAGNIPLVGFFDLMCVLSAGHRAWVKPSSKDRVLMEYVCNLLKLIEPNIPIFIYDESASYDAVIATGGDEANKYFEQRFSDTKRLCRGSRHSIAILDNGTTEEDIRLLTGDIYKYSGLGCRNVSMLCVPKGMRVSLPNYEVNKKYKNNYIQTKALLTIRGYEFYDTGNSIILPSKDFPQSLSTISLWEYDSLSEIEKWIKEHDPEIQCIVTRSIEHPRRVDFGEAQHPTLHDYADGIDTMKFLELND